MQFRFCKELAPNIKLDEKFLESLLLSTIKWNSTSSYECSKYDRTWSKRLKTWRDIEICYPIEDAIDTAWRRNLAVFLFAIVSPPFTDPVEAEFLAEKSKDLFYSPLTSSVRPMGPNIPTIAEESFFVLAWSIDRESKSYYDPSRGFSYTHIATYGSLNTNWNASNMYKALAAKNNGYKWRVTYVQCWTIAVNAHAIEGRR